MPHYSDMDDYANSQRRILLIANDPSLRALLSRFLVTMGCSCAMVSNRGIDPIVEYETFDAVLLDACHSEISVDQILNMIDRNRPGLSERVLLIRRSGSDPQSIEVLDREAPRCTSGAVQMQQLWSMLEAIFTSSGMPKSLPRRMQIGRVIFDSSHSSRARGVRGLHVASRRLAYQHENATIDILIEPVDASGRMLITGQVLHLDAALAGNDDLPVLLVSGSRTVVRSNTNSFGEFSFECEPVEDGCIEVRLGEGTWISLPLGALDWVKRSIVD